MHEPFPPVAVLETFTSNIRSAVPGNNLESEEFFTILKFEAFAVMLSTVPSSFIPPLDRLVLKALEATELIVTVGKFPYLETVLALGVMQTKTALIVPKTIAGTLTDVTHGFIPTLVGVCWAGSVTFTFMYADDVSVPVVVSEYKAGYVPPLKGLFVPGA